MEDKIKNIDLQLAGFKETFDKSFEEESNQIGKRPQNRNIILDEEEEFKAPAAVAINFEEAQSVPGRQQMVFEPEKNKKLRKLLDNYLNSIPQDAFQQGQSKVKTKKHFLCYNMYGSIIIRNESAGKICTVEMAYSNTQFGRKTIVPTTLVSMGSLNNTGALLASSGYVQKDDEYENEELTDELKLAKLCFYSSTSNKSWEVSLPKDVNIQAIALGYHWIAVATSEKYIRFLSPNGIDTNIIGFNNPVVGMCSYESHLAVFYHDSYPFSGNQFLKVKVINVTTLRSVLDIPVCLSHDSELRWYGFSEEGILYT